ncbi:hypothetical protein [Bacillus cereus group sp. BY6-1LC]|jgi:hypothetical protein|uniref:hypothetical protein n=1 Tax=Bacillus cereus group sp. BY6-1LC TaxID=3018077 RepID=UPI0022E7C03B|nr:hypothetical protein [Bacillus cereus group sp. BY6-1LC]MDA1802865.1 hypothetical protein [Bacillus cereus group sp. BY6-1LC]
MTRIDFHTVDFSKITIIDNYNYHSEDYHSYNLEFRVQEHPNERFLICVDIWDEEWRIGRIAQMHHEKYYILDDVLKEKFKNGLKKVLAIP